MTFHASKDYICPICLGIQGVESDQTMIRSEDIVFQDDLVMVFVASYFIGNNPGHLIVVPKSHYENLYDLPDEVCGKIMITARKMALVMRQAYNCQGVTLLQNNEPVGDQHAFHFHLHLFPRYPNDELHQHMTLKRTTTVEERLPYAKKNQEIIMTIQSYKPQDKTRILTLMQEFMDYLAALDPMKRIVFAPQADEYLVGKMLSDTATNNGHIFVAEESGEIVGFIGGYVSQQSKDELMETKKAIPGTISEFFITANSRHSGIGSQLISHLEQHLKAQGCTLIRFEVFAPNTLARDFYRKHGYQDRTVIISKDL